MLCLTSVVLKQFVASFGIFQKMCPRVRDFCHPYNKLDDILIMSHNSSVSILVRILSSFSSNGKPHVPCSLSFSMTSLILYLEDKLFQLYQGSVVVY